MHIYSKVDESRKMKTTNNFEPRKYVVYADILLVRNLLHALPCSTG